MKVLIIGNRKRYEKFMPCMPFIQTLDIVYCPRDAEDALLIEAGADADAIMIDPTVKLNPDVVAKMPSLKIIQSEGVGFEGINHPSITERGIYICNCKGANADAVAEQTLLLLLALLRDFITGDQMVREGRQLETKERMMLEGIQEIADLKVGFIGFGDIAKATAMRLLAFNCEMYYHTPHQKEPSVENAHRVKYCTLDELASTCDVIIVLCLVTSETTGMINASFLEKMKPTAYLINTARGEIVDNDALYHAIITEQIKGAALDTVSPIPVTKDNILLTLPPEYKGRIIFSPHIGGVTTRFFYKAHEANWRNIERIYKRQRPNRIVNGL